MNRSRIGALLSMVALAFVVGGLWLSGGKQAEAQQPVYFASLTGAEAVPPNDSAAAGTFVAHFDGEVLAFEISVPDIKSATSATVHLGGRGEEGEMVAFLFRPAAPSVEGPSERAREVGSAFEFDAVSSLDIRGELTPVDACGFQCSAQLFGSLRGDVDGLIEELEAGNVYVIVSTKEYRGGEIRGQVGVTDEEDPRVLALAEADDPTATSSANAIRSDDDGAFPAWAWAVVVGVVRVVLIGGAQFRPKRRP